MAMSCEQQTQWEQSEAAQCYFDEAEAEQAWEEFRAGQEQLEYEEMLADPLYQAWVDARSAEHELELRYAREVG